MNDFLKSMVPATATSLPDPMPLVHWQEWGEEALSQAEAEGKPIFLFIGYAACRWCQQMELESFADPSTAELMNRLFVNIKVDRDVRPDLDNIYQMGHKILTKHPGGWPLTAFLCPRTQLPFLMGTYFPKEEGEGRMAFASLLEKVSDYYHDRGRDFVDTVDRVREAYREAEKNGHTMDADAELSRIPVDRCLSDLLKQADQQHGGFGAVPKFPMPAGLEYLYGAVLNGGSQAEAAKQHLGHTLLTMAQSGIHDQVGGGFFRYAIDSRWMVPHFEKVLCDNAQLLALYAEAWQLLQHKSLSWAAKNVQRWLVEKLRSPVGGFYSALSAESEGGEGRSYLWSREEVRRILTSGESAIVHAVYDLDKYPNVGELWHFHRERSWEQISVELELSEAEVRRLLNSAHDKLLKEREHRPQPACDEKIITSWNALAIRGLAVYARVFADQDSVKLAQQTVDFIRHKVWKNNALSAYWQEGKSHSEAFADDYVFLMDALLELLRVEWRESDYQFLISLTESLLTHYVDETHGGLFLSRRSNPVFRSKPFVDQTLPAVNGVAAKVLNRMGHFCGEPRYLKAAKNILLAGWGSALRIPLGHYSYLGALSEHLSQPLLVLLKGAEQQQWARRIQENYGDHVHCFWIPDDGQLCPPELLAVEEGEAIVYVDDEALDPITELSVLTKELARLLYKKDKDSD